MGASCPLIFMSQQSPFPGQVFPVPADNPIDQAAKMQGRVSIEEAVQNIGNNSFLALYTAIQNIRVHLPFYNTQARLRILDLLQSTELEIMRETPEISQAAKKDNEDV